MAKDLEAQAGVVSGTTTGDNTDGAAILQALLDMQKLLQNVKSEEFTKASAEFSKESKQYVKGLSNLTYFLITPLVGIASSFAGKVIGK